MATSLQLRHYWCLKSLLWLLRLSLKVASASSMYFFRSSLTALVTLTQYTTCDVRHSKFRGQLFLLWQLHPNDAVLGFNMLLLWDETTELIFFMQLKLRFAVSLLKMLCNFKNTLSTLIYTFLNRVDWRKLYFFYASFLHYFEDIMFHLLNIWDQPWSHSLVGLCCRSYWFIEYFLTEQCFRYTFDNWFRHLFQNIWEVVRVFINVNGIIIGLLMRFV